MLIGSNKMPIKMLKDFSISLLSLYGALCYARGVNMNMSFPFGQPLKNVCQADKSPKKVFILGVYASAVHAKWVGTDGRVISPALAVASEPEIFWTGTNGQDIVAKITIPSALGHLEASDAMYNGPSGRALDDFYLSPLHLTRKDVWLCDLVPHSCRNAKQADALKRCYNPIVKQYNLPEATIPPLPQSLTDEKRRNEITDELFASQATEIILLGDAPIKWYLNFVSDFKKTGLNEIGVNNYGQLIKVTIRGKDFTVLALVHPRQAAKLDNYYSPKWEQAHRNWLAGLN
jgi:hypothetical protein